MKKLFLLLLAVPVLAFAQGKMPRQSATYDAQIIRVSDGDTIVIAAPFLPAPLKPELAVRIYGVDTPENQDQAERDAGQSRAVDAGA
jgi:endonuclease YncB( thermonuclease family)